MLILSVSIWVRMAAVAVSKLSLENRAEWCAVCDLHSLT